MNKKPQNIYQYYSKSRQPKKVVVEPPKVIYSTRLKQYIKITPYSCEIKNGSNVYTQKEASLIKNSRISDNDLLAIHQIKNLFNGEILAIKEKNNER